MSRYSGENMTSEETKSNVLAFFSEAISKWVRLIQLYNTIRTTTHSRSCETEANDVLIWFQENYDRYFSYSDFRIVENRENGKQVTRDPIFDVIFQGVNITNITRNPHHFASELNMGLAALRAHLANVRNKKELIIQKETPILRVEKILSRFWLVANQLRERPRNKRPYSIEDEYDVQDLLHAILKLDFDDIRREEWTPSYAGGASKIDLVLKEEKIIIEVKKTRDDLREKNRFAAN